MRPMTFVTHPPNHHHLVACPVSSSSVSGDHLHSSAHHHHHHRAPPPIKTTDMSAVPHPPPSMSIHHHSRAQPHIAEPVYPQQQRHHLERTPTSPDHRSLSSSSSSLSSHNQQQLYPLYCGPKNHQHLVPSGTMVIGVRGQITHTADPIPTMSAAAPVPFSKHAHPPPPSLHSRADIAGVEAFLARTGTPPMSPRIVAHQNSLAQLSQFTTEMVALIWRGITLSPYSQDYQDFNHFIHKILRCTYHNITPPVIILSLLYLQRFKLALPSADPEPKSEYGVWTTAIILADAFVNDNSFTIKSWSQVSHFSTKDCAIMKRNFLKILRFNLSVGREEYEHWVMTLERVVSLDRHAFHPISELSRYPPQPPQIMYPTAPPPLSTAVMVPASRSHFVHSSASL